MRLLSMLAIAALVSAPALAVKCPALAGTYQCGNDEKPTLITQSLTNGVTSYKIEDGLGLEGIADGKRRLVPDASNEDGKTYETWTCTSASTLRWELQMVVDHHKLPAIYMTWKKKGVDIDVTVGQVNEEDSAKVFRCHAINL